MTDDKDDIVNELDLTPEEGARHLNGALKREFFIDHSRDLTPADIQALSAPGARSVVPHSLRRIHASHHALARCIAVGMNNAQASLVTGYSTGRIGHLKSDPAFKALVAEYTSEAKSIVANATERMIGIHLDAMELLHEKMHDNPGELTVQMLLDIVKTFADRTGHGPGQQIHVTSDRDFIDRPPRESFEDWEKRRNQELKLLN